MDQLHNATPPIKGRGVIVGVVDLRLDIYHPDLRRSDGTTRILSLWDQTLTPQAGERAPAGFSYGVAYDATAVDAELSRPGGTAPYQIVRHGGSTIRSSVESFRTEPRATPNRWASVRSR